MVIGTVFQFINDIIEVRVEGNNCLFRVANQFGGGFVPIDNLKLDKKGSLKEHPDLIDRDDWREETIKRFKDKMKNYNTEMERMDYVINDLKKVGYVPLYKQQKGFRCIKF